MISNNNEMHSNSNQKVTAIEDAQNSWFWPRCAFHVEARKNHVPFEQTRFSAHKRDDAQQ